MVDFMSFNLGFKKKKFWTSHPYTLSYKVLIESSFSILSENFLAYCEICSKSSLPYKKEISLKFFSILIKISWMYCEIYLKSNLPFLYIRGHVSGTSSFLYGIIFFKVTDTFVYIMHENAALGMHPKFYFHSNQWYSTYHFY